MRFAADSYEHGPWKLPLPRFIEELYFERLGKAAPNASCPSRTALAATNKR